MRSKCLFFPPAFLLSFSPTNSGNQVLLLSPTSLLLSLWLLAAAAKPDLLGAGWAMAKSVGEINYILGRDARHQLQGRWTWEKAFPVASAPEPTLHPQVIESLSWHLFYGFLSVAVIRMWYGVGSLDSPTAERSRNLRLLWPFSRWENRLREGP